MCYVEKKRWSMFDGAKDRARQAAAGMVLTAAGNVSDGDELEEMERAASRAGSDGVTDAVRESMGGASRGQTSAQGAVSLVVALMVGGLMAAFLLPIAIDEISTVDTANWDGGAAALWGIIPVIVVLAVFLFFVGVALSYSGRI